MEFTDGPARTPETEFKKLTEEIKDMEDEEKILLTQNKKSAVSLVYMANFLAIIFFIFWSEAAREKFDVQFLLISSIVPLLAIFCLFMMFRYYDFKQKDLQKYLRDNFYVLLVLFIVLTIISIIKI